MSVLKSFNTKYKRGQLQRCPHALILSQNRQAALSRCGARAISRSADRERAKSGAAHQGAHSLNDMVSADAGLFQQFGRFAGTGHGLHRQRDNLRLGAIVS
jgi:hypothetical protein